MSIMTLGDSRSACLLRRLCQARGWHEACLDLGLQLSLQLGLNLQLLRLRIELVCLGSRHLGLLLSTHLPSTA